MQNKEKIRPVLLTGIAVLALAILGVLIWAVAGRSTPEPAPEPTPKPTPEVIIREKEVERIVEVERTVTVSMLREGLSDVGRLITQEYFFTEVISYSTMLNLDLDLKFFQINEPLPITESSFLASFDGVVTAGVDFTRIEVEKDEESRTVTVKLPQAEIFHVDIDPESFQLYDEKKGLGTQIGVEDYNNAFIQLENTAADKAKTRGILEKAEENARTVVDNFIHSILDQDDYTVVFAGTKP